ncbi:MAG: hypothetical protein JXR76_21690 [Deltaproteobacteria bacterium]|nr:hypothetical protein [Deltaproteobacteria bacterium]
MDKLKLMHVVLLASALLAGCGEDSDGGGGSVGTLTPPVEAETQASEMEEDDAAKFCSDAFAIMMDASKTVASKMAADACPAAGFVAGYSEYFEDESDDDSIKEACETAVTECEEAAEEAEEPDEVTEEDYCEGVVSTLADCDVEVGKIADCINALNKVTIEYANSLSTPACSSLTVEYFDDYEEPDPDDGEIDECDGVIDECSGLAAMAAAAM